MKKSGLLFCLIYFFFYKMFIKLKYLYFYWLDDILDKFVKVSFLLIWKERICVDKIYIGVLFRGCEVWLEYKGL